MSCHARGRCHFCSQKHTLTVFGSKKSEYNVMQKANLNLIVLNTVCSSCINILDTFIGNKITNLVHPVELTKEKDTINKITEASTCLQSTRLEKCPNHNGSTVNKECQTEDTPHKVDYVISDSVNISKANNARKKSLLLMYCDFCQKEFNHTGDLNKHRRKHTKEKPYLCCLCKQQFSHASNLVRHQRIHSGDRPFLCKKCQCSFYRKDKLSQHLSSKHCALASSSINTQ